MLGHVLVITTLAIARANCFLENITELFAYDNVTQIETEACQPLTTNQQYYWQSTANANSTEAVKLDCLYEDLSKDKYFPKCCPPNYLYYAKHHKCIPSGASNIHSYLGTANLLIRTDLINCTTILDQIHLKKGTTMTINSDRSLSYGGTVYPLGKYCLDNLMEEEQFILRTCEEVDVCRNDGVKCIKKCCPDGQYYKGALCYPGPEFGISLENTTRFLDSDDTFNAIMISKPCRRYIGSAKYNYHITEDGTTAIEEWGVWKYYSLEENYYCMEYVQLMDKHEILLCMTQNRLTGSVGVKGVLLLISSVALLLTLLGYFILPDLQNLIGKIVITYCICLLVAFILLTWLQFHPFPGKFCEFFAFSIAFSFLTAFTWMTILSYEIWRVLGSMVTDYGKRSPGERRRYIQYSVFGWSLPTVIIFINFLDYMYNIFPKAIHLVLGNERCVYENIRERGIYGYIFHFAMPCAVLLGINLVVFIKTIIYIFQVKNEINKMKVLDCNIKQKNWKTFVADKEKVAMVLRIFLLMGINWLFETFSSIVDFNGNQTLLIIEMIFDYINAMQGIFIFCIFMLKKKILKSFLNLLNAKKNRRSSVATCSTEVVMIPTSNRTSHSY